MPWIRHATRDEVDRILRAAYPTRALEDLDAEALDKQLSLDQLPTLLDQLSVSGGFTAVIEPEIVKSHILHVGKAEYPDWVAFNRELSRAERPAAISEAGGEMVFWNILLSRVGPFWTGSWNSFRIRHNRVVPELTAQPTDSGWSTITHSVKTGLASFGMYEVDKRMCEESVPWLRHTRRGTNAHSPLPTVYDSLFSEMY